MQVIEGIGSLKNPLAGSVVTIGNFDGVHRGHRQLVDNVVREARYYNVPSVVYTFHPHPVKVLQPQKPTFRLFDLKDQQEQLDKAGIEIMVIENFTKDFSKISAEEFLQKFVVDKLHPKTLVVGHDFSFGANRSGNISFLERFSAEKGLRLIVIPPFQDHKGVVSSSRIREALRNGDVALANDLLGRSYYVRGHVEPGFQRGRTIGVPTANIHPDVEFIPRQGVYCTLTKVGNHLHPSITNIGINPTFTDRTSVKPVKIESHLLDFEAQLYGVEVEVHLMHFLRDEKKFSGIDELKKQIQSDIQDARRYFNERPKNS